MAAEFGALRTDNSVQFAPAPDGDAAPAGGVVHVVDDDAAVRDSLACLLDSAGFAVQAHASAEHLLAGAAALAPGCVLTDVRMPGLDGLGLQRRLGELGLHVSVVVMTGHGDVPLVVQAMKAGAVDFLQTPFTEAQLLAAVGQAMAAQRRRCETAATAAAAGALLASLTPREHEVLAGRVAGHPTKVITKTLGASPRTIEVHRGRVMEKLGVQSLPDLVRLVQAAG